MGTTENPRTAAEAKAVGLVQIAGHWEARRLHAIDEADRLASNGDSSLALLRESSRCEARCNKLVRLIERACAPRGAE